MPTRLIDVGKSNSVKLRLVVTHSTKGKWVALSHLWGEKGLLKTTSHKFEEIRSGV